MNVKTNPKWIAAIFRYAVEHPELISKYHLNDEYFPDNILRYYAPIKHYYLDVYGQVTFSQRLLEEAYFTYVKPDLKDAYFNGTKDLLPEEKKKEFERELFNISVLFDETRDVNNLGPDFIEDKMKQLVCQEAIFSRAATLNRTITTLREEDLSSEEYTEKIREIEETTLRKYQLPSANDEIIHDIFTDPSIRIKVDTRKFPSLITPLNEYLTGGFRRQATYGFMTKTGSGKSTFMITLAADALQSGLNVAYVNLEMNSYEVAANIMSALSRKFSYTDVLENLSDDSFINSVHDEVGCYIDNHLTYIGWSSEDRCDMKWLKNQLKNSELYKAKKTDNPDFKFDIVLIDYLFLMEPSQKMMKNARSDEKYTQLAREVHKLSQEECYCVITVFQSNRGAESKLNSGGIITLDDTGDSYGANREIEYCFGIQRDMDNDGVLINRLKSRHYDGDKTDLIFIPYDRRGRRYDSMNARFVTMEEVVERVNEKGDRKRGRQPKYPDGLRIEEFLTKYPKFCEYPAGTISIAFSSCEGVIKSCKVKEVIESLGYKPKTKDDVPADFDYEKAKEEIKKAVEECLAERQGKPKLMIGDESIVKISGKELFL